MFDVARVDGKQLQTPVVCLVFNRPDVTQKVFEAIREAKPAKLLVVADGARVHKAGEAEKCAATRAIFDRVDWDCEVLTNYSDKNLGCKNRVSTGLDWVFTMVEEAIILEDDCLPDPSFFGFCEELLERYRDDERIMSICGTNYQLGRRRTEDSYYFSVYSNCWGWATWRRAWKYYDIDMKLWPQLRETDFLKNLLVERRGVEVWNKVFNDMYEGKFDSWFFRWMFCCWVQSGLSVVADQNLISNIGGGPEATHTATNDGEEWVFMNMPVEAIDLPLRHPSFMIRNYKADRFVQNHYYNYSRNIVKGIKRRINKLLRRKIFNLYTD